MTGPEHYAEAERLLAALPEQADGYAVAQVTAAAQVHATLALAAATLDARHYRTGETPKADTTWDEVIR